MEGRRIISLKWGKSLGSDDLHRRVILMINIFTQLKHTLEMVKFSHSVFALPFALASLLFATNGHPSARLLLLVILAMVSARNVAMTFNRLVDTHIDAKNPRTVKRHLPQKILSFRFAIIFCLVNAMVFVFIAALLNQVTLWLSPVVLFVICLYSFTKRWTPFSHIFLGFALGLSPLGAWIAATGEFDWFPILLGAAVLFWVAGFDIIYAIQDYDFDRKEGLKSFVVSLGISKALRLSNLFHVCTIILFLLIGIMADLQIYYFLTIVVISLFLVYEHRLVLPSDLSRINAAFFRANGFVGLLFLFGTILEVTL